MSEKAKYIVCKKILANFQNKRYTTINNNEEVILGLLHDYVFKNVFGVDGHEDVLKFLVNTVFIDKGFNPVKKVELKNSELIKETYWQKTAVLDIRAEDDLGRSLNIEVQVQDNDNFRGRSLSYWSRLHILQEKKGDSYKELQPTICINFLNFDLFDDGKMHHCIMAKDIDENGKVFSPDMQIHYIELKKIDKIESKLEELAYIIKNLKENTRDEMENLLIKDAYYEQIQEYFEHCVEDEQTRYEVIVRERNMKDYTGGLLAAQQRGIEQGAHEKAIDTAKKLIEMGLPLDKILIATGLKEEDVHLISRNLRP